MTTWGRLFWPFWIVLSSSTFLGPELIALFTNRANTLSEYSWAELHVTGYVKVHTTAWWVSLIAWLLAVVVLTLHIWYRKLT